MAIDEEKAASILRNCWPKYRIEESIGWGSYGTVFRVRSDELERAVKIMQLAVKRKQNKDGSTAASEMLQREWNTLQQQYHTLSNSNVIVKIHDFHKEQARVTAGDHVAEAYGAILMDYWPWDLERYRLDHPNLSAEDKRHLLEGIAGLLEQLHTKDSYLYTDLKPANILLSTDSGKTLSAMVLGDVGGLKSIHSINRSFADQTNNYMSPEVMSGKKFPPESDAALRATVWSFGMVGCYVLQGYLPHEESYDKAEAIRDHGLDLEPKNIEGLGRVVDAVQRCLQYDPSFRPSGFGEILGMMRRVADVPTLRPVPGRSPEEERQTKLKREIPKRGDESRCPITGVEFVFVPSDEFLMGQSEVEKQYLKKNYPDLYDKFFSDEQINGKPFLVKISSGFWMAKYLVTVGQFRKFVEEIGFMTEAERNIGFEGSMVFKDGKWQAVKGTSWRNPGFKQEEEHPVVCVSWNDAMAFLEWLNKKVDGKYCLPTESQWEYAARAGTSTIRYWGDDLQEKEACQYANVGDQAHFTGSVFKCDGNYKYTSPVGSFTRNLFGLYDMLGNVWEWTCSDYSRYDGAGKDYAKCGGMGSNRVIRGGGWYDNPAHVRSADRDDNDPGYRDSNLGLRLARTNP